MSQNVDLIALARTVVGSGPDVARSIQSTPRQVPSPVRTYTTIGLVLGLLSIGAGLAIQTDRTLGVVLTCIVYFIGVSQGGVMFSVAQTAALGRWGRPFKRIAESFVVMLPILYLLWIVFLLAGGLHIYEWTHEPMHGHKAIWLQPGFFVARQVVCLGVLFLLSLTFVRNSLRPDMGVAAEALGSRAPAWWGRITLGWKGRDAEIEDAYQRNIKLAPVMIVTYALVFTLFAVDAVMSLAPHWYANMFPAWIFVSSFWVSVSWICLFAVIGGKWMQIDHLIGRTHFHDLGKLMFALCIFWAYTFFAQLLPIWYGNMPEETSYLLLRLYTDTWSPLSKVVVSMCFLIPFTVLLSRGIKKLPRSLAGVAVVISLGVFLERFTLVMPQVWKEDSLPIGPLEVGILIGFVSLFVRVVTTFLAQVPPIPVSDPFMNPNPSDVHIHAGGDHHGHAHA
ncbi:MAG: hypothetical protein Q8P41_07195 [Pseudomonadota bacterium]|nr:hypothetical protein [Pseudomonadota bacterium]